MVERNIAKITMEISEPTVTNVQRDIKVTFVDQLGTIGGTLGLFCGLSIVSLLELVYYLLLSVTQLTRVEVEREEEMEESPAEEKEGNPKMTLKMPPAERLI